MVKRQIPVMGIKENELIKTLNENLHPTPNKVAASQEYFENNTDTETDNELNEHAQEVYDSCGTDVATGEPKLLNSINGYAGASPYTAFDNIRMFKDLSPEAMEKINNVIRPEAESILKRFDNLKNSLKDNEDSRKAVNSEIGSSATLTDYGKKMLEVGKKAGRLVTGKETEYEMVNHPSHYNQYDIEVIDMIIKIWGPEAAALWCDITAFKYRMRMGTKPDNSIEQDIKKEQWYLNKAREIRASIVRENLINKN